MNSWKTDEEGRIARARATRLFCGWLHDPANAADRKACTLPPKPTPAEEDAASVAAKELFARLGQFDLEDPTHPSPPSIPANTKFKVYEMDPRKGRDELVTMVLPPLDAKFPDPFAAVDYYPCTYWPYL
jgi:hypothetical protein